MRAGTMSVLSMTAPWRLTFVAQSDVQYWRSGRGDKFNKNFYFSSHLCQLLASVGFPGPTLFTWPQVTTLDFRPNSCISDLIFGSPFGPRAPFFLPPFSLSWPSPIPNPASRVLAFSFQEEKYGISFPEGKILVGDYYVNLPCYGLKSGKIWPGNLGSILGLPFDASTKEEQTRMAALIHFKKLKYEGGLSGQLDFGKP